MNYIIVSSEFLQYVDYSRVKQSYPESLRYSIDKKKFILKYVGEQPDFIFQITKDAIGLREYSHDEIIEILKGEEWVKINQTDNRD